MEANLLRIGTSMIGGCAVGGALGGELWSFIGAVVGGLGSIYGVWKDRCSSNP